MAAAALVHGADKVVAEANNGGAMVESVLRAADAMLPVKLVHASRGKVARAEPVAALYEAVAAIDTALRPTLRLSPAHKIYPVLPSASAISLRLFSTP